MSQFGRYSGFGEPTPVVKNLILLNIAAFVACLLYPNITEVLSVYYPTNPAFKPWQIVTYLFMHAGFMHIFSNMFALFMFGCTLERLLGSKRFIYLYFASGIGAILFNFFVLTIIIKNQTGNFMLHPDLLLDADGKRFFLMDGELTNRVLQHINNTRLAEIYFTSSLGASGAVYGVMAAFAYLLPNTEFYMMFIPIPIKVKYLVPGILILYDLQNAFGNDNVGHFAHLGGALFGFLLVLFWNKTNKKSFY